MQPQPNQLQLKATDDVLKGTYSNLVQIHHTKEEFVLDCMTALPPAATLNARIILAPGHAKRLVQALADAVKRFEEQNGVITASAEAPAEIGFKA
ncbi:MAG: hypothetical protein RLZZ324_612 [Candidatus Parcubacteria bacterium]|jgi:hypothetical protein